MAYSIGQQKTQANSEFWLEKLRERARTSLARQKAKEARKAEVLKVQELQALAVNFGAKFNQSDVNRAKRLRDRYVKSCKFHAKRDGVDSFEAANALKLALIQQAIVDAGEKAGF